jgi:hypothetical protein
MEITDNHDARPEGIVDLGDMRLSPQVPTARGWPCALASPFQTGPAPTASTSLVAASEADLS